MVITIDHITKVFVIGHDNSLVGNGATQNIEITGLWRLFTHADGIKTLRAEKVSHRNTSAFVDNKLRH